MAELASQEVSDVVVDKLALSSVYVGITRILIS